MFCCKRGQLSNQPFRTSLDRSGLLQSTSYHQLYKYVLGIYANSRAVLVAKELAFSEASTLFRCIFLHVEIYQSQHRRVLQSYQGWIDSFKSGQSPIGRQVLESPQSLRLARCVSYKGVLKFKNCTWGSNFFLVDFH